MDSSQALPPSFPKTVLSRSRTAVNFSPHPVVSSAFMMCNFTAAGNKIDHCSSPEALFVLTFISAFLWSKVFKECQEPTCYRILMPWLPERSAFRLVLLCHCCPISGFQESSVHTLAWCNLMQCLHSCCPFGFYYAFSWVTFGRAWCCAGRTLFDCMNDFTHFCCVVSNESELWKSCWVSENSITPQ